MEYYGIKNSVLQWISSFLHGRTQRVVCNGSTSDPVNATSGVPQGTVLGPLLFLTYIHDLPECISFSCCLFVDDCLLYGKIETDNDRRILQQDLFNVDMWERKWLMTLNFNVDKCVIVQISLKPQCETSYILYNNKLKQVTDAKYLGVIIDSKLSFNKHVDVICKKANSTLAFDP